MVAYSLAFDVPFLFFSPFVVICSMISTIVRFASDVFLIYRVSLLKNRTGGWLGWLIGWYGVDGWMDGWDKGDAGWGGEAFHLHLYQIPYHHAMRLTLGLIGRVMACDRRDGDGADEDEDVSNLWSRMLVCILYMRGGRGRKRWLSIEFIQVAFIGYVFVLYEYYVLLDVCLLCFLLRSCRC